MKKTSTQSRLEKFIAALKIYLEKERGRKTALTTYLNVRPHQLSEWLAGLNAPNAENVLGIQEWLAKGRAEKK